MKNILSCAVILISPVLPASAAMLGYYPLDTNFEDHSGSGNHATAVGTVTIDALTAAIGGGSAFFNNGAAGGSGNLLSVNHGAGGLNLSSLPVFTLSMWFNTTADQTDRRIFSEGSTTNTNPLYNLGTGPTTNNSALDFFRRLPSGTVTNNHEVSSQNPFETGTWHNLVWIDSAGAIDLYLDGSFSRSFTYTDSDLAVNTTTFGGILRATAGNGFTGHLDDIGIWNEAPANPAAFAAAIAAGAPADTVSLTIPEPAAGMLTLLALGGLVTRRQRR